MTAVWLLQNVLFVVLEPIGRNDVLRLLQSHRAVAYCLVKGVLDQILLTWRQRHSRGMGPGMSARCWDYPTSPARGSWDLSGCRQAQAR